MIVRCGCDLVDVERLARKLDQSDGHLEKRIFDEEEQAYCQGKPEKAAGLFAAKEAVAKALGSGIWGKGGLGFTDFIIRHEETGRPYLELSAKAREFASSIGHLISEDLSISHEKGLAMAFCTLVFNRGSDDLRSETKVNNTV